MTPPPVEPPLPSQPPAETPLSPVGAADLEAAKEEGASIGIGLAAAVLAVGLVVGFLIGIRARQLISAVKNIPKAAITLKDVMKAGKKADDGAGDTEKLDEDPDGEEDVGDIMDQFYSTDTTTGLDDHPDVVRSPIIMYHIKLAKDDARREKRKQALLAEGMDEEDAERLLLDEAAGVGMFGGVLNSDGTRANALATLISVGARVTSAGNNAQSAEAAAQEERKRAARTIDAFLSKSRGIDTTRTQPVKSASRKNAADALEIAIATKQKPYGGETAERIDKAAVQARTGRLLLRSLTQRRDKEGFVVPGRDDDLMHADVGEDGLLEGEITLLAGQESADGTNDDFGDDAFEGSDHEDVMIENSTEDEYDEDSG